MKAGPAGRAPTQAVARSRLVKPAIAMAHSPAATATVIVMVVGCGVPAGAAAMYHGARGPGRHRQHHGADAERDQGGGNGVEPTKGRLSYRGGLLCSLRAFRVGG